MLNKKEFRAQSFSFESLKRELKDKDEMISALKQKLEIMESFHCSSSSFDALNSFQDRRSSSVVVIAEDSQIPSPTFKSLRRFDFSLKSSKRDSKVGHRERSHTAESTIYCSLIPLQSPNSDQFVRANRSASILPSIKHIFSIPFSTRKVSEDDVEGKCDGKRKQSFFKNIFTRKQNLKKLEQSTESICSMEKVFFDSIDDLCPTFSYEEIISGRVPLHELDIERIEKYLKWEDCIEWLGATKEELKLLRSNSLNMRKRSVFLCADQLKNYSKDVSKQ